jgi:hypothetical protein
MEKTKYRTVSNGHWDYLQYLVVKKFLWIKYDEWQYVPKPYCSTFSGRPDSIESNTHINSLNDYPANFVNKYPYIDEYLKIYRANQAELEAKANKERQEYEDKKNRVRYFN